MCSDKTEDVTEMLSLSCTHPRWVYVSRDPVRAMRNKSRATLHGWRETFVRVRTGHTGRKAQPMIETSFLKVGFILLYLLVIPVYSRYRARC